MSRLFFSVVTAFVGTILAGCGDDSPTGPTLDTAPKRVEGWFQIKEWNGSDWVKTTSESDRVAYEITWRFISHKEEADGSVNVDVGYNLELRNPTSRKVTFLLEKFRFEDEARITIAEVQIDDTFEIQGGASRDRTGTVNIQVGSLSVTELIVDMSLFAGAGFYVE